MLTEERQYATDTEYAKAMMGQGRFTAQLIRDRLEASVREAMRGQKAEEIRKATRQAKRDAWLLYQLHIKTNVTILQELKAYQLRNALLGERLRGIVDRKGSGNSNSSVLALEEHNPRLIGLNLIDFELWEEEAECYFTEVFISWAAAETISRRYLDGHLILSRDTENGLNEVIENIERIVAAHKLLFSSRNGHNVKNGRQKRNGRTFVAEPGIDLDEIRQAGFEHCRKMVQRIIDEARLDTAEAMGDHGMKEMIMKLVNGL